MERFIWSPDETLCVRASMIGKLYISMNSNSENVIDISDTQNHVIAHINFHKDAKLANKWLRDTVEFLENLDVEIKVDDKVKRMGY